MKFDKELKQTKEDWIFFFKLKNSSLSPEKKEDLLYEHLLAKFRAVYNSDELLECEKEENLLTLDQYVELL